MLLDILTVWLVVALGFAFIAGFLELDLTFHAVLYWPVTAAAILGQLIREIFK